MPSKHADYVSTTWQLKGLPGAELMWGANAVGLYRVYSEHLMISLQEEGEVTAKFCGMQDRIRPDDMSIVPPDTFSTWDSVKGGYLSLFIPCKAFDEAVAQSGERRAASRLAAVRMTDRVAAARLRQLHWVAKTPGAPLESADLLLGILERTALVETAVSSSDRPRAHREIALARDYLRENLAKTVTMDELVALTGLSGFHFWRMFRQIVGLPPHAYQNYIRVAHAKRLLAEGEGPSVVATAIGFCDQSHLALHFKKWVHMTPGSYRQIHVGARRAPRTASGSKNIL